MTTLRNVIIAAALGALFVGFTVWQYQPPSPEVIAEREAQAERRQRVEEMLQPREVDSAALAACQIAGARLVRNQSTLEWDLWSATSRHQGSDVWAHRIPLTAENDFGVTKRATLLCQTIGDTVLALEIE